MHNHYVLADAICNCPKPSNLDYNDANGNHNFNDNDWKFSGISQLHPFIPTSTKTTSTSVSYENCAIT